MTPKKKTHYKLGLYEVLRLASCYFYGNLLRKQVHRLTSQSASRSIHSCLRWQQNCELPAAPCFWIRHAKLCLNVSLQNSMKIPLGTGFDTHTKAQGTKCENQRPGTDHMKRRVESQKSKHCLRFEQREKLCKAGCFSATLRKKQPVHISKGKKPR